MIVWLLRKLGFVVVFTCEWGDYYYRYDYLDYAQTRPIHKDMSVAPPWAKMKILGRDARPAG